MRGACELAPSACMEFMHALCAACSGCLCCSSTVLLMRVLIPHSPPTLPCRPRPSPYRHVAMDVHITWLRCPTTVDRPGIYLLHLIARLPACFDSPRSAYYVGHAPRPPRPRCAMHTSVQRSHTPRSTGGLAHQQHVPPTNDSTHSNKVWAGCKLFIGPCSGACVRLCSFGAVCDLRVCFDAWIINVEINHYRSLGIMGSLERPCADLHVLACVQRIAILVGPGAAPCYILANAACATASIVRVYLYAHLRTSHFHTANARLCYKIIYRAYLRTYTHVRIRFCKPKRSNSN